MPVDKLVASLYFIGIIIVLVIGDFGVLTIPGVVVAIFGIIAIYKKHYSIASLAAILAATISITAQSITGWCMSCIIAAAMFAIAGLLACERKMQLIGIPIFLVILILSLSSIVPVNGMKTANSSKSSSPSPQADLINALADPGKDLNTQIPLLYVSEYCPSCKDVLKRYIQNDPQGQHWRPVMVSPGHADKSMLTDMGYTGEVYQSVSVSQAVPCLIFGNKKYIGERNILSVFVPGE